MPSEDETPGDETSAGSAFSCHFPASASAVIHADLISVDERASEPSGERHQAGSPELGGEFPWTWLIVIAPPGCDR